MPIVLLCSQDGGGGKFEDPELREIASNLPKIVEMLQTTAGLKEGVSLADVGCGTGLCVRAFSEALDHKP